MNMRRKNSVGPREARMKSMPEARRAPETTLLLLQGRLRYKKKFSKAILRQGKKTPAPAFFREFRKKCRRPFSKGKSGYILSRNKLAPPLPVAASPTRRQYGPFTRFMFPAANSPDFLRQLCPHAPALDPALTPGCFTEAFHVGLH